MNISRIMKILELNSGNMIRKSNFNLSLIGSEACPDFCKGGEFHLEHMPLMSIPTLDTPLDKLIHMI